MTFGTILTLMAVKYTPAAIRQWRGYVDAWIKDDIEGFRKFKTEVFDIINSSKKTAKSVGFEIINPKC